MGTTELASSIVIFWIIVLLTMNAVGESFTDADLTFNTGISGSLDLLLNIMTFQVYQVPTLIVLFLDIVALLTFIVAIMIVRGIS